MYVLDGLLSLRDMGGRRRLKDRRESLSQHHLPERRQEGKRRTGFDRRSILGCTIRKSFERRSAFKALGPE